MNRADIKARRAGRRNALIAEGALIDARRSMATRVKPSAKRYARKPRTGAWS